MEILTAVVMAERLGGGISSDAVKRRLQRKGIAPYRYIGTAGIYKEADFEAIKDSVRGRPKVDSKAKKAPKNKTKKTTAKGNKRP